MVERVGRALGRLDLDLLDLLGVDTDSTSACVAAMAVWVK